MGCVCRLCWFSGPSATKCHKLGVGGGLTAADVHSFPGVEARSLKSRCGRGQAPPGGSRGRSFFASSGLWGQAVLWLVAAFLQSLPLSAFGSVSRSVLCVSLLKVLLQEAGPLRGPRVDSYLALGNELSKETPDDKARGFIRGSQSRVLR